MRREFCDFCGAGVGEHRRHGEGTCPHCDPGKPLSILVGCECSGRVRDALRDMGHNAWSCDVLGPDSLDSGLTRDEWIDQWRAQTWGNYHLEGDVRWFLDGPPGQAPGMIRGWDVLIAHPPCTRLTNSGVRWLYGKRGKGKVRNEEQWQAMIAAAEFYAELWCAPIPVVVLENPTMHGHAVRAIDAAIARRGGPARKPVCYVQPYMFGDGFSKKTGFEIRGAPPIHIPLPETWHPGRVQAVHKMGPGSGRWYWRSLTYPGIARMLAEQYGGRVLAKYKRDDIAGGPSR